MSYTEKLTETDGENLDVRVIEILSKFGARNSETMQWTFDNQKVFALARALIDSEASHIMEVLKSEQWDPTSDKTLLTPVIEAKSAMGQRGIPYAQFKDMFPKFLEAYDAQWKTGTPPTENNDYDHYIVAVRRAHDPESVWVFPAAYANNYDGELQDQDGIAFIANGWFDEAKDADGCDSFSPTLDKGDEVLGWKPMPKYHT
jgi:hypothetical protein